MNIQLPGVNASTTDLEAKINDYASSLTTEPEWAQAFAQGVGVRLQHYAPQITAPYFLGELYRVLGAVMEFYKEGGTRVSSDIIEQIPSLIDATCPPAFGRAVLELEKQLVTHRRQGQFFNGENRRLIANSEVYANRPWYKTT